LVKSAFRNNPLCENRDCRYCRRPGLTTRSGRPGRARPRGIFEGSERLMKKVAIVTAAVLALGLAACNKNNAENNAANETAVENTASNDVNAATENAGAQANADAALNAAGNEVANAGAAVNTASNAVENK